MDSRTRAVYAAVAWISLVVIVAVSAYGIGESLYGSKEPIGQYFVDVYWPVSPYFAQPVTYFDVACVALFYSGMRLWEEKVAKWPKWVLSFLQLVGFVVAFEAAYEVMYNFMLWGSTYTIACAGAQGACNPDVLDVFYPYAWNLLFATRAFAALFVVSGYSVYYLRKLAGSGTV